MHTPKVLKFMRPMICNATRLCSLLYYQFVLTVTSTEAWSKIPLPSEAHQLDPKLPMFYLLR